MEEVTSLEVTCTRPTNLLGSRMSKTENDVCLPPPEVSVLCVLASPQQCVGLQLVSLPSLDACCCCVSGSLLGSLWEVVVLVLMQVELGSLCVALAVAPLQAATAVVGRWASGLSLETTE